MTATRPTIVCLALSAAWPAPAGAEPEPLTRARAVEIALEQNPQIAASRASEAAAKARLGQAKALVYPKITLDLGVGPGLEAELVEGTAVQSVEDAYGDVGFEDLSVTGIARLSILQPIYTFGKASLRQEAAEHEIRARRAQTRMTRAEVALEVARAYEGYLFAREALRFFEDLEHRLERTVQSIEDRLESEAADVGQQDLLRLQVALSAARVGRHRAEAGLRKARSGLRAYLALGETAEVELEEQALEPLSGSLEEVEALVRLAKQRRPELDALREGSTAREKLAEAEKAGYFPNLFLLGFANGAYTPNRDLVDTRYVVDPLYHFVPGLLVGLRWELQGDLPSERAEEQRAEARLLARREAWALEGLPAEVRTAYADARRAREDMRELARAVEKAKRWMVRASADFAAGLGDTAEITDAVEAYFRSRTGQLDAIYRYNLARAELAKATGTLAARGELYPGGGTE